MWYWIRAYCSLRVLAFYPPIFESINPSLTQPLRFVFENSVNESDERGVQQMVQLLGYLKDHDVLDFAGFTLEGHRPRELRAATNTVSVHEQQYSLYDAKEYMPYISPYIPHLASKLHQIINAEPDTLTDGTILEEHRYRHTYITGRTGSGKSELIKVFIHEYLQTPDYCATILIDPAGDLVEQIALFPELHDTERLVYISPTLSSEQTAVINPFDLQGDSTANINIRAQQIKIAFEEMMKGTNNLSLQMEAILLPCIDAVIRYGGTLVDLQDMMIDPPDSPIMQAALASPSIVHRKFFQNKLFSDRYENTKTAIYTRIQSLLVYEAFYHMVNGRSTVNLRQAIEQKKFIAFNLSKGLLGEEGSQAFGRFLVAIITSIGLERQAISDRTPTHAFIDECQNFLSPKIRTMLAELRKYGVYLTLSQQYYGQDMDTELKAAILSNTNIKISGQNNLTVATPLAKEMEIAPEIIQGLEVGEFAVRCGNEPPFKIKCHSRLLGDKHRISEKQWNKAKARQLDLYYRPIVDEPLAEPTNAGSPPPSRARKKPKYGLPE